jgi:hypothetical protein
MRSGIAADAAAALLFRVFSQPALLFPPPGHAQDLNGVRQSVYGFPRHAASPREQVILIILLVEFYFLKCPNFLCILSSLVQPIEGRFDNCDI